MLTTSPDPQERERARYTVMVVPTQGRGSVRQVDVTTRHLRRGVAAAAALGVCALLGVVSVLGGGLGRGALVAENQALQERLVSLEQTVSAAEAELEQIRQQQAHLSALSGGYGPLDAEESKLLGTVDRPGRLPLPGEDGTPMEEPPSSTARGGGRGGGESLTVAQAEAVGQRATRLLDALRRMGPELERLISVAWARQDTMPSIWPTQGFLTSGFGMRRSPINREWKFHQGLDIGAPRGTPVVASAAGVVVRSEYTSGYGNLVEIDHGDGVVTRYGHNSRRLVEVGDPVLRGDVIATVGSTGQSTGPHLHYEVHIDGEPVDPAEYILD